MRAQEIAFLTELAAYQKKLETACKGDAELTHWLDVLARWQSHPEAEEIWLTLKDNLPANLIPTAEEFIYFIERRSEIARKLDAVASEAPDLENKFSRHRAKKFIKNREYLRLAHEAAVLDDVITQSDLLLGRKK